MLRVHYPLVRGGPPRLEVKWSEGYRKLRVRLDDVIVASSDVASLRRGRTFELPDGRSLAITMQRGVAIWIDGEPVPGTYADPWIRVKSAPIWVLSYGLAAAWRALQLAPERPWPLRTWASLGLAGSLLLCALPMRRGSYHAHLIALIVLFVWLVQAFPHVQLSVEDEESAIRVLSVVVYAAVGAWVLRKIAFGTAAAREIHRPRAPQS